MSAKNKHKTDNSSSSDVRNSGYRACEPTTERDMRLKAAPHKPAILRGFLGKSQSLVNNKYLSFQQPNEQLLEIPCFSELELLLRKCRPFYLPGGSVNQ